MSLSWLPNSVVKDISIPRIEFVEQNANYSGYYIRGKIVACENDYLASTLAHEFKHCVQDHEGTLQESGSYLSEMIEKEVPYEQMIQRYFRDIKSEFEALLFEVKFAKSDLNDWWLNKLVLEDWRGCPYSL